MAKPRGNAVFEEQMNAELQKELQTVVSIVDDALKATDQNLSSLKELKQKLLNPESSLSRNLPPPEFRCPISGLPMNDPVIIASTQAYDRPFIQKWLENAHETCPQTDKVLSHMILTPNHPLKEMISRWSKEHEVVLPSPLKDVEEDQDRIVSLPEKLSSSDHSDLKMAGTDIRQLKERVNSFLVHFGKIADAISHLDEQLLSGKADTDPELQEDLVEAVYYLAFFDAEVQLLEKNAGIIPFLIEALKIGRGGTKRHAAAALLSLSAFDSNKSKIGELGLNILIELLAEGDQRAKEDADSIIRRLCTVEENKRRAVSVGVVKVIMQKTKTDIVMNELLELLALLVNQQKAIEEMAKLGAVSLLLDIMRESTSDLDKENCLVILYVISVDHREKLEEIRNEEDANGTISQLAQNGTQEAKRWANLFLGLLNLQAFATTA